MEQRTKHKALKWDTNRCVLADKHESLCIPLNASDF